MIFSKVRYNNGQRKFEIKFFEDNGMTLGKWVINENDFQKTIKMIENKFGLKNKETKSKDLDWAFN